MQDIFENARRIASSAVERAAWEADKLRRAAARQREIELAQRERGTLLEQIGHVIAELEGRGQLNNATLSALAQRLRSLDAEIEHGHTDVNGIRSETFAPGSVSVAVVRRASDDVTCPTCGRPSRRGAMFCANCGARIPAPRTQP
jgi:hypothetical protein